MICHTFELLNDMPNCLYQYMYHTALYIMLLSIHVPHGNIYNVVIYNSYSCVVSSQHIGRSTNVTGNCS